MKLDEHINYCIVNYPSLYKNVDYQNSRIRVLGHVFLTIGTGYEWVPQGYMKSSQYRKRSIKLVGNKLKSIPEGFFDTRLFEANIKEGDIPKVLSILGDAFHYFREREYYTTAPEGCLELVFDGRDEKILEEIKNYHEMLHLGRCDLKTEHYKFLHSAEAYAGPYKPYPVCHYSPVDEMAKGKTNSLHVENFDLHPKLDWLRGGIEIVDYSIKYYSTPELYECRGKEGLDNRNKEHELKTLTEILTKLKELEKTYEKQKQKTKKVND